MRYSIQRVVYTAVLVLCSGFLGVGLASAQAIDLNKMNKIPHYAKMPQAEFEAKSKLFTEIPQGDLFLEYSIRLRDGWQKLGMSETEREAVSDDAVQSSPTDKFDISNLRDEKLADDKNNVSRSEGEDSEVADLDIQGDMTPKRGARDITVSDDSNITLLGPVAKYVGPPNLLALSRLEIFAMQLSQGITTKNWLLSYILSRNYTLMGMEQISENRVEAEYVMIEKGITYVVRTAAISNGNRRVLISYFVPEKFWEKEREYQEMTIDSFKFINPEKARIDDKKNHGFLDLVKFSYPTAWKLIAPNVYSIDNMSAKLLSSNDNITLQGEMNINLISTEMDTNLMKEVEYIRQDLKKRGLGIGAALDINETYKFSDKITFSRVEAYEVSGEKKEFIDYEFWLAIMVEDRYYYIVTMLTPGRKADFYAWALNTETFSSVIQSMMPQVAGETLDSSYETKTKGPDSGGAPVP